MVDCLTISIYGVIAKKVDHNLQVSVTITRERNEPTALPDLPSHEVAQLNH